MNDKEKKRMVKFFKWVSSKNCIINFKTKKEAKRPEKSKSKTNYKKPKDQNRAKRKIIKIEEAACYIIIKNKEKTR